MECTNATALSDGKSFTLNLKLGEVHEKDYYPIGTHEVVWDGSDSQGNVVASGLYFYQLKAGSFVETRKMLFIR